MEKTMDMNASTTFGEQTLRIFVAKFPNESRKPVCQHE